MSPSRIARNGSPFEQQLVRAARGEDPPEGAEERALAALGLATLASGDALRVARPRASGALHSVATLVTLVTLVAIGFVGGALALVGVTARPLARPAPSIRKAMNVARIEPPSGEEPQRGATWLGPGSSTSASSASSAEPAPAPLFSERHDVRVRANVLSQARPLARPPGVTNAGAAEATPLSLEIALVEQAARALAGGEPRVALTLLDTYRRECPRGTLEEEAGVLRVLAFARNGDISEAKRLARQLLEANPSGLLAPRLRAAIDEGTLPVSRAPRAGAL